MIPCSNRIQEILEWVNGECIADIGCDHAYVVCNAILNHQSKKGYACDVAQGPLDNAKKTIVANHLEDFVSCCLLDGIQGLAIDVDQIIICGIQAARKKAIIGLKIHPIIINFVVGVFISLLFLVWQ